MKCLDIRQKALSVVFSLMLAVSNIISAQEIAPLPVDPAIKTGTLPNGTRWYVVSNPYVKDVADFAVVQNVGFNTTPALDKSSVLEHSRESLASQPLLLAPTVQDYFVRHGAVPGPSGFAHVSGNTTVFRFGDVDLKSSESVLDSTLLVLTNIVGSSGFPADEDLKKWYSPSDQAIIVAGDVDAKLVSDKLKMLSYMVPASESKPRKPYEWKDEDGLVVELSDSSVEGIAHIRASWRLQRMPVELMNTVMPAIYEKYMAVAGEIIERRINKSLQDKGVPVSSVSWEYVGSGITSGDEKFMVSVTVPCGDVDEAVAILAESVSSLDAHGAFAPEITIAAKVFEDGLYEADNSHDVCNSEYVDRCMRSFVYNTPLASKKHMREFHSSRELDDSTECRIFRSIVSATFDDSRNLTLAVRTGGQQLSEDHVRSAFLSSWQKARIEVPLMKTPVAPQLDTVSESKLKIRSVRKEYLSGGSVMTLSNGMKIMYRKMLPEEGILHYSLSLNGGTGNIDGLCVEDGVYLEEFFRSCEIGGVDGQAFFDMVRSNGMTLNCHVGHSVTDFKGRIPSDKLDHLFSVLLTVMNTRKADFKSWEYYLAGEPLRQISGSAAGHLSCLTDDFADRADKFFTSLSEKINDGILVLVGDIDENELKNAVKTYAGGFKTEDRAFVRTDTFNSSLSGNTRDYRRGDAGIIEIRISAALPLTVDNYYASMLTSMILERNLSEASAGTGALVDVVHECRRYPQESILMKVIMREIPVEGFADGTVEYDRKAAVGSVRNVMSSMYDMKMAEDVLTRCRNRMVRSLQMEMKRPEYWMNALKLRYLAGKDFTTGAEARIKALKADDVKRILSYLEKGTKVEYIITER